MDGLKRYSSTLHVIASHSAAIDGDAAMSVTRCAAHHLHGSGADRRDLVMHIRYDDRLERRSEGWLFAERDIHVVALMDQPAPRP